jgi:hypothetical protein
MRKDRLVLFGTKCKLTYATPQQVVAYEFSLVTKNVHRESAEVHAAICRTHNFLWLALKYVGSDQLHLPRILVHQKPEFSPNSCYCCSTSPLNCSITRVYWL